MNFTSWLKVTFVKRIRKTYKIKNSDIQVNIWVRKIREKKYEYMSMETDIWDVS